MIQHTRITVEVDLAYDADVITEHDAQQNFLEHGLMLAGIGGVEVHHAVITSGLVDSDGVPA